MINPPVIFSVVLRWSEGDDKWHMYIRARGKEFFIYDFFHCENFDKYFKGLDRSKDNHYTIGIKRDDDSHH